MKKISLLYCLLMFLLSGCGSSSKPEIGYKIPFLHQNKVHFLDEMNPKKEQVKGHKKTWITFDMNASETVYIDDEGVMNYFSKDSKQSIQASDRTMGVLVRNQIVYSIDQQEDGYVLTTYQISDKSLKPVNHLKRQGSFLSWNFVEEILLVSEYQD